MEFERLIFLLFSSSSLLIALLLLRLVNKKVLVNWKLIFKYEAKKTSDFAKNLDEILIKISKSNK